MRIFSLKKMLIVIGAVALVGLLYWHFIVLRRGVEDIIPNVISDIVFAIFMVLFIEYANKKDREQRSRGRRRALARAVQAFYQNLVQVLDSLILDGVLSLRSVDLPSSDEVMKKAEQLHKQSVSVSEFSTNPYPFAAYFIAGFTGHTKANVFPVRSSKEYITHLANRHEQLYRDVFYFDDGFLPDDLVDVLTNVKNQSLFLFGRNLTMIGSVKIGYWAEDELKQIAQYLGKMRRYFSKELGYSSGDDEEIIRNDVLNALNNSKRQFSHAKAES